MKGPAASDSTLASQGSHLDNRCSLRGSGHNSGRSKARWTARFEMHVFIDTSILLNFYHFTSDDLDALNSVFVSHTQGTVTVHLTDQVRDEFNRNREAKLRDALKQFRT